jgi:hypothetical protein
MGNKKLNQDQKFSARLEQGFDLKDQYPPISNVVDIIKLYRVHTTVIVDYYIWFIPIKWHKVQMFRTIPSKDCENCLGWLYE